MVFKFTIIFTCTLLVFSESAYVDTIQKCDKDDFTCGKRLFKDVVTFLGDEGMPEYNIPRLDPMEVEDVTLVIDDLANFLLPKAKVSGLKSCVVDDIGGDYSEGHTFIDTTCDITVAGKYILQEVSGAILKLTQNKTLSGNGDIKLDVEKIKLKLHVYYGFYVKNGEVHLKLDSSKMRYDFEVGKVNLYANKIFLGEEDASETIVAFVNENYAFLLNTFGRKILDVVFSIANPIIESFFDAVSVNHLVTNDMSIYVKN